MSFEDFPEEIITQYTPVKFIGHDKRSTTYLVKKNNEDDQKQFLLKKVSGIDKLPFIENPRYRGEVKRDIKRFKNEIKRLETIDNENIIKITDQMITSDTIYYVTEYYESTLRGILEKKHRELGTSRQHVGPEFDSQVQKASFLPIATVVSAMHSLLTSLNYLHTYKSGFIKSYFITESIMHRDIKPDNIYVLDDREKQKYVLFNFGCCSYFERKDPHTTGNTLGDSIYRHPEAEDFKELEPRMDIYSAGVTMYEMLTGNLPYSKSTLTQYRQRKCKEGVQFPDIIPKSVGMLTKMVCYKALEYQKYAATPYTTVSEMLNDFNTAVKKDFKLMYVFYC